MAAVLALGFWVLIAGAGTSSQLGTNGYALFATAAPGVHWGTWRSITRCDCKAYSHCLADMPLNESDSRTAQLWRMKACSLVTGATESCQIVAESSRAEMQVRVLHPNPSSSWRLELKLLDHLFE